MKNVLDIKSDKGLDFVLSETSKIRASSLVDKELLVVVCLYYKESLNKYIDYIKCVPKEASILIVTSNLDVKFVIDDLLGDSGLSYRILEKENRGRDISALLVATREEILKYKYVCFVHDKKAKSKSVEHDIEIFVECLWRNMLGSEIYIQNIVSVLESNDNIGVLFPPEPVTEAFSVATTNTWFNNFEQTRELVKKLNLSCDLDEHKKPISVGTVFFAKTAALKKLFEYQWGYEDFDEEPLANDGTISHAVERCFAYVAQDAGYDSGIVMTESYAVARINYLQNTITQMTDWLEITQNIKSIREFKRDYVMHVELLQVINRATNVYVYGAGIYGKKCINLLRILNVRPKAIVVTKKEDFCSAIEGIPIQQFSDTHVGQDDLIVIAAGTRYIAEIKNEICNKYSSFSNIVCLNYD